MNYEQSSVNIVKYVITLTHLFYSRTRAPRITNVPVKKISSPYIIPCYTSSGPPSNVAIPTISGLSRPSTDDIVRIPDETPGVTGPGTTLQGRLTTPHRQRTKDDILRTSHDRPSSARIRQGRPTRPYRPLSRRNRTNPPRTTHARRTIWSRRAHQRDVRSGPPSASGRTRDESARTCDARPRV